ncbi:hypothetical protein Taro_021263 [Colocasia esculenta]|uniref:FAS1 domain-containing protein n=1 Tax=Colocasia esculenta TaxID=4460 RepID=A0A843V0V5_COLES|nr:hypothetical protein [Colocasia esculenta]
MAASSYDTTSSSILLLALLLLSCCSAASAFNITKILDQQPDFSAFNSYLTQTQLAAAINGRETITVLAVANGAVSSISGMSVDDMRKVLSVHVVLDYYDDEKLKNLNKKSTILTTLFQSTGVANDQMGFLNVSKTPDGVRLGSAVRGAGLTVDLVKSVASQPYNISVLQVSGVIIPPGIQNTNQTTNSIAAKAPAKAPKGAPSPKKAAAPATNAPSASSQGPAASSPTADSPDASSPPAPAAPSEAPAADSPAPSKSKHASAPAGDSPSDSPKSDAAADAPSAMASRSSAATTTSFLLVTFFFLFSSPAAAFNITRILDQTPDFSTFNNYLSQTKLAAEINRRRTITILAVDNAAVSAALSGQPLEIIREILSVHVILDYYDIPKLRGMKRQSTVLTSLFQSTGLADDEMGFVNLTKTPSGIRLGSAEPGAGLTVDLIKTVAARPYNISVLQVSGVIVPPGIRDMGDDIVTPPPPQTAPAPEKEAPAPAPEAESPDAVSPPAPSGPAEAPEAADSQAQTTRRRHLDMSFSGA